MLFGTVAGAWVLILSGRQKGRPRKAAARGHCGAAAAGDPRARGVKVIDAEGRESPDGLKTKELARRGGNHARGRTQGWQTRAARNSLGHEAQPSAVSEPIAQQDTSRLIPLTDLAEHEYQGFQGGLYPGGKNSRPPGHEAAGVKLAGQVQPLDAEGKASQSGKIVLLGIGFSNTVQAFAGFMRVAQRDRDVNPKLVLVNGAVGGMSAAMVQDPDDQKRGTKYWATVDERLEAAGVTRMQVQVVWIKETDPAPHEGGFPKYTQTLEIRTDEDRAGPAPADFPTLSWPTCRAAPTAAGRGGRAAARRATPSRTPTNRASPSSGSSSASCGASRR